MTHSITASALLATAGFLLFAAACGKAPEAPCVRSPAATAPTATTAASAVVATTTAPTTVEGTWLFRCCDGSATWVGMVTLVESNGALRGAWLTDGDSHGSYLEGSLDGAHVTLSRRWRTGAVLHEQQYDLTLDDSGQHLSGSFREPAFDAAPHTVQLERGFVKEPRSVPAVAVATPVLTPIGAEKGPERDPKRPCDCKLVCYCGGVPPGPEHYEEQARCGGSCKCRVCPPLP